MGIIGFLVLFPIAIALILLVVKNEMARGFIVRTSAVAVIVASIYMIITDFSAKSLYFKLDSELISYIMMGIEAILAIFIIVLCIKYKKYLALILTAILTPFFIGFELIKGHSITVDNQIFVDKLTLIMVGIIGIIGSIIIIYAVGYMKDFQKHHKELKDRRNIFFFLLFIFISAMFGIVLANNLSWLFFFWEITTICSFLLIGYTKTEEAIKNSFRAITYNLMGGLSFAIAIIYMGYKFNILELDKLISLGSNGNGTIILIPLFLLSFAGLTKAAQMPFSSWLVGAMVAPTPTSALLHSSTMVKAGVYLILRLSPDLAGNYAGYMVSLVGGITFIIASLIAISQSNGKKVLAYSTIANLGLIVTCAGIGTYEAMWAAIMLIIFHAVAKSLLFLCVGTVEHQLGSRDIEDMDGLIILMPKIAIMMIIGIAGMFLAPFGMLISKWAAMKSFIDSQNLILLLILIFGSAATLFYWTKWIGKIVSVINHKPVSDKSIHKDEWVSIGTLAFLTVLLCSIFPIISQYMVEPMLQNVFGTGYIQIISSTDIGIMLIMIAMLILLPISYIALHQDTKNQKLAPVYMAGENTGDNMSFHGSLGKTQEMTLKNWYMSKYFGESNLALFGVVFTITLIVVVAVAIGLGGMV